MTSKKSYVKTFTFMIVSAAAAICWYSVCTLPVTKLDAPFLILSFAVVAFGSRLTVQAPKAKVHISVSDSLVFLTLLIYGGEAAVLLAASEACYASLRFRKRGVFIRFDGILFNAALMACSTFLTAQVLQGFFGPVDGLTRGTPSLFITALCVMALVQYTVNSGLAAVYTACETEAPVWSTWSTHYFPASATYVVGAATAGILVKLIEQVGFYTIFATAPVIILLYLTHRRYIDDVKASSAQAEQAERERAEAEYRRAEAERVRAEQAEQHVEELNHHLAEQARISEELEDSKEHFRHAAYHDALTGLPNRAMFVECLEQAIEQARKDDVYLFAVLFLDLDRFKNINDSLGHSYGDQLLITTSHRLQGCVRQGDTVARFGGDEFAVLLNGIRRPSDAVRVAETIQMRLKVPVTLDSHCASTTASIGIALSTAGYGQPEEVLRDADTAAYTAKDGGRARHVVFDEAMHARAMSLLKLENDLRQAVERGEFCNYYQPIVHLQTGELAGFEALVRWHHPEHGMISPAEFIPMAEDTGMIMPIGMSVLEKACLQLRQWQRLSPSAEKLSVSVNLSGRQLSQPDLVEEVKQILRMTDLDPRCLKLEVTESVVMENADNAFQVLGQLRHLGVRLSIDDFGTGYSSLSYLHRFPVDILKIDRSFVSRISLDRENHEIARTIVMLAHNLRMEVVAEGVETQHQQSLLRALECEYGQGYLYSKPLSWQEAEALIVTGQQVLGGASALSDSADAERRKMSESIDSTLVM